MPFFRMSSELERHERYRRLVCAVCLCQEGRKADRWVRPGSLEEEVIRGSIDPTYSSLDTGSPGGTCIQCRRRLFDVASGKESALRVASGIDLGLPRVTRGSVHELCTCYFCTVGSLTGGAWNAWRKKARGRREVAGVEGSRRRCGECFAPLFPGCSHDTSRCGKEVAKVQHLQEALPLAIRAKLAAATLREVAESQGQSVVHLQGITGGKATTVSLNSSNIPDMPVLSAEKAVQMKISADLSDRYPEKYIVFVSSCISSRIVQSIFTLSIWVTFERRDILRNAVSKLVEDLNFFENGPGHSSLPRHDAIPNLLYIKQQLAMIYPEVC